MADVGVDHFVGTEVKIFNFAIFVSCYDEVQAFIVYNLIRLEIS